jgi:hypothetical protein
MTRITLNMSYVDMVYAITNGNAGAIDVCAGALKRSHEIDPDNVMGGVGILLDFDRMRIYGSDIWTLFKDVCGGDIVNVLALCRAVQLGELAGVTEKALKDAIRRVSAPGERGEPIDCAAALAAVKERLPRFAATPTAEIATQQPQG